VHRPASCRVRFINTYEPVTSIFRDLPPTLAGAGTDVEVVISSAEYRATRSGLDALLAEHGVRVVRIPCGIAAADSRLRKLWVLATYVLGTVAYTLFGRKVELNVFLTQPPLFSAWGPLLRVVRREKFACIVMDLYPDVAVASRQIKAGGVLDRLMQRVGRWTLRRADAVIVIGRCMADRLAADGVPRSRMHLVTNWADEGAVRDCPLTGNRLRAELGLEGRFVVLYSGNMGIAHTFDEVMHAAGKLAVRRDIHFVFVGDGARRGEIEEAVHARHLQNVTLLPFQPRERMADSMGLGSVHLITQRPGMEGVVVPSKAYSAFAAGRAVIYVGDSRGEIARTVVDSGVGTVVAPGDGDGLAAVIAAYADDPERAVRQGIGSARLARERFSAVACIGRYQRIIVATARGGDANLEEPA
jgi:colanic acid biosynthesis glycosyl transferase WcaI